MKQLLSGFVQLFPNWSFCLRFCPFASLWMPWNKWFGAQALELNLALNYSSNHLTLEKLLNL